MLLKKTKKLTNYLYNIFNKHEHEISKLKTILDIIDYCEEQKKYCSTHPQLINKFKLNIAGYNTNFKNLDYTKIFNELKHYSNESEIKPVDPNYLKYEYDWFNKSNKYMTITDLVQKNGSPELKRFLRLNNKNVPDTGVMVYGSSVPLKGSQVISKQSKQPKKSVPIKYENTHTDTFILPEKKLYNTMMSRRNSNQTNPNTVKRNSSYKSSNFDNTPPIIKKR